MNLIAEEIKDLIVVGGTPCLGCLIGFGFAFVFFPEDGFKGMWVVGVSTFSATIVALLLILNRIFRNES